MGIEKLAEELGGAFLAEKALGAVDPDAGFLEKAATAVVGFEGGGAIGDLVSGFLHKDDEAAADTGEESQPQASDDDAGQWQDDQNA